ncbi:phage portal protein [Micromonospora gifhornensis]|uniref:phage portal protein n=1 Tax=Micromonospora gifhornensis TaxID=84594 RepID=UPI0034512772
MNLLTRITARSSSARSGIPLNQLLSLVGSDPYTLLQTHASWGAEERMETSFTAAAQHAMKTSGVVWASLAVRAQLFAEARLTWQGLTRGRPDRLFGTDALRIFERPWPRGTTRDLLIRMMLDADLAGTGLVARRGPDRLARMRPDWCTLVLASREEPVDSAAPPLDAELFGVIYEPPGGRPEVVLADEVAVFAPMPDPIAWWRGSSWLISILRELQADSAATEHRLAFFRNGATPNLVISFEPTMKMEQVRQFKEMLEAEHRSAVNAYKTLYLAGAKATPVGHDFKAMDLRAISGLSETRVAAAAGVHPVILGLSEGLAGSSLNAGNYGQVRRRLADITMAPLWSAAASALAPLVTAPAGARLWYDVRDVPALREDRKDVAEIQFRQAQAMRSLVDGGFEPQSVIDAIESEDMSLLRHTGNLSVQLQPPRSGTNGGNGSGDDGSDAA